MLDLAFCRLDKGRPALLQEGISLIWRKSTSFLRKLREEIQPYHETIHNVWSPIVNLLEFSPCLRPLELPNVRNIFFDLVEVPDQPLQIG